MTCKESLVAAKASGDKAFLFIYSIGSHAANVVPCQSSPADM